MFDKEFSLAIATCGWNFAGTGAAEVERLAAEVDWTRFIALVGRHRVGTLAWQCLDQLGVSVPRHAAETLSGEAAATIRINLLAALASARLRDAFDEAGLPILFVKGLTVSAIAYGNPFIKMASDIDILVDGDRVAEAGDVLATAGFELLTPIKGDLASWHRTCKESDWRTTGGSLQLDLHTQLADSPALLPTLGLNSPRQSVTIAAGIELPTLASDELFAYLCVHGASSAWFRLKWITDVAALLDGLGAGEIARLYAQSQRLGAGRAVGQALLLAHALYQTDLGDELRSMLERDRRTCWLVRIAVRELTGRADLKEPTEVALGTVLIRLSQLLMLPGWNFKKAELFRQFREFAG